MYESIMWTYIREEQGLLKNLLKDKEVKETAKKLSDIEALYIVAHGSSYNAANAIAPLLGKLAKLRVFVYTPSQVMHNEIPLFLENQKTTYVCGISQTGTSRGVLEALDMISGCGFRILGITDVEDSPLEKKSNYALHLKCQGEDSNAKTKGYSSTMLVLCKLAVEIAQIKGVVDQTYVKNFYTALEKEIEDLNLAAQKVHDWCKNRNYGLGMSHVYVVGSGMNYAIAMEGQLKLMETVCIPTMFSNIEEFSHGMHRSLNEDSYVLLLDTPKGHDLTEKTYHYLKEKNVDVLMLSSCTEISEDRVICFPNYEFTDSIFLITIAIQVISVFVPEVNGTDPNRCANDDYTKWVETRVN